MILVLVHAILIHDDGRGLDALAVDGVEAKEASFSSRPSK
jgi:hypothetical protein